MDSKMVVSISGDSNSMANSMEMELPNSLVSLSSTLLSIPLVTNMYWYSWYSYYPYPPPPVYDPISMMYLALQWIWYPYYMALSLEIYRTALETIRRAMEMLTKTMESTYAVQTK